MCVADVVFVFDVVVVPRVVVFDAGNVRVGVAVAFVGVDVAVVVAANYSVGVAGVVMIALFGGVVVVVVVVIGVATVVYAVVGVGVAGLSC